MRIQKAVIVIEPRPELRLGILNKMNSLRNSVERNLWLLLLIRKSTKNYQLSIISPEGHLPNNGASGKALPITEANISEEGMYSAFERSIELANQWHLYGDLPQLLQISGVNIGEALQAEMIDRFSPLLKQIELAHSLLEKKKPGIVYLESDLFPSGRAFEAAAKARGIKYSFIQPNPYRNLKKRLISVLRYKRFKKALLTSNLYSINKDPDNASYRILVDTPYINWFTTVLPVIWELLSRNVCKCYLLGKEPDVTGKFENVQRIDINYGRKAESKQIAKIIRTYYHSKLKKDTEFQKIFTYRGIKLWDTIKGDIDYLFDKKFIDVISNLLPFSKVIDAIKPDILVLGAGDKATAVASHVLLAKRLSIPVLEIRHGLIPSKAPPNPPQSDRIAIGGEYWKKIYIKAGTRDEQVVVTGWPKYDVYHTLKDNLLEEKRDTLNILFATQPIDIKLNLDIIELIGSFVEDFAHIHLIVKPHPGENTKAYYQVAKRYKQVILHDSREDIARLIACSDALITMFSTVGMEAELLDKPIICLNFANEETKPVYVSSGVAIEVKNLDELIPAIKDALYNEEVRARLAEARKKFVYQHAYLQDGQASKRVADLIIQMIEESRKARVEA